MSKFAFDHLSSAELKDRMTALSRSYKNSEPWRGDDEARFNSLCDAYDSRADLRQNAIPFGRDGGSLERGPVNRDRFSNNYRGSDGGADTGLLDRALSGWMRNALGQRVTAEDFDACQEYGAPINANSFTARLPLGRAKNALSTGQLSTGGALTTEGFIPRLETALLSYSGILAAGEIINTDDGNDTKWPTINDTGNVGARIGENADATSVVSEMTFGDLRLGAYTFTSGLVKISTALMEDSGTNLASSLGGLLGERIGRKLNVDFTTGTGGASPMGLVTGATTGVTAVSSTAIAADEILDLIHSVDPAYREVDGCGFMFNDSIFKALRKLKDGIGRYLWQPGIEADKPETLLGYPYFLNQSMDSAMASGKKTVVFGALPKYKIRRVRDIRIVKLMERFAEFDQQGFIAYLRADGGLIDAGTHPVKLLAHP